MGERKKNQFFDVVRGAHETAQKKLFFHIFFFLLNASTYKLFRPTLFSVLHPVFFFLQLSRLVRIVCQSSVLLHYSHFFLILSFQFISLYFILFHLKWSTWVRKLSTKKQQPKMKWRERTHWTPHSNTNVCTTENSQKAMTLWLHVCLNVIQHNIFYSTARQKKRERK